MVLQIAGQGLVSECFLGHLFFCYDRIWNVDQTGSSDRIHTVFPRRNPGILHDATGDEWISIPPQYHQRPVFRPRVLWTMGLLFTVVWPISRISENRGHRMDSDSPIFSDGTRALRHRPSCEQPEQRRIDLFFSRKVFVCFEIVNRHCMGGILHCVFTLALGNPSVSLYQGDHPSMLVRLVGYLIARCKSSVVHRHLLSIHIVIQVDFSEPPSCNSLRYGTDAIQDVCGHIVCGDRIQLVRIGETLVQAFNPAPIGGGASAWVWIHLGRLTLQDDSSSVWKSECFSLRRDGQSWWQCHVTLFRTDDCISAHRWLHKLINFLVRFLSNFSSGDRRLQIEIIGD